jgi:hypothetical protein
MEEGNILLVIQHLEKQLADRLEKLWKIFSWSASVLMVLAGGVISLTKINSIPVSIWHRVLFSVMAFSLTLYAWQWIRENLALEKQLRDELEKLFERHYQYTSLRNFRPDKARFGYAAVIIVLGAIAILANWVV